MGELDEAVGRWRRGEEQLYPVVTVRPDLYEACIGVVRSLADHLGRVPDLDALVATYRTSDPGQELEEAGVSRAQLAPEIDLSLVRDAAYQVRSRELAMREANERTERLIRRAQAEGHETVVIWSQGESELWPPYRRVEMALASGNAVAVTTEMDPDRMTPRFVLEAYALDPATGEALDEEPLSPRREFTDLDAWHAARDGLRASLLTNR